MNRKERRARAAHGMHPTEDKVDTLRCSVCQAVVIRFTLPRPPDANSLTFRALRLHCRTTGCIPLDQIEPVSIPAPGEGMTSRVKGPMSEFEADPEKPPEPAPQ
jgi:hypothetical protein